MEKICEMCNRNGVRGAEICLNKRSNKLLCHSCATCLWDHERRIYGRVTPEERRKKIQYFKKWYLMNKKRHIFNVSSYNKKIKPKNSIRRMTQFFSEDIILSLGKRCSNCGSENNLEIDHKNYKKLKLSWKKADREESVKKLLKIVRLLCRDCHRRGHRLEKNLNKQQ